MSDVRRLVINDAFTTMLLNGSESLGDHIMADFRTTYANIHNI